MAHRTNEFGQPIGPPLPNWTPPPAPPRTPMLGRYCQLEPLAVAHADVLHAGFDADPAGWTYLFHGPFLDAGAFAEWLATCAASTDPLFFAVIDGGMPVGIVSYLRIAPAAGSIEVGHIHYTASAKKSRAVTEAMYLMMRRAFELGYRRYEWKCDSLNAGSRAAAQRLGFSFEGVFRQAIVYKGRSRDTAWYAMIDSEWPAMRAAFEAWLSLDNFDETGRQKRRLSELTAPVLVARG